MNAYSLSPIPPHRDVETKPILKQLALAHRHLAELKGTAKTIPNEVILINTLPLLEAKDSSAIENIITTHDEIYKEDLFENFISNPNVKEVHKYAKAVQVGFKSLQQNELITNKIILSLQEIIVENNAGLRKLPGTELKNLATGETVYIPPQDYNTIVSLMQNLEEYINDDSLHPVDPLIKMAIIHYQFESIHPFYDGNGRTGRILNILYLVQKGLLDLPILYLSSYIIKTKIDYYRLLQEVRDKENWEDWILYMLKGVEITSKGTIYLVKEISRLMMEYKHKIRTQYKFYSQDLINNLFKHPYTKIEYLQKDLNIHRHTAASYLEELVKGGLLRKEKVGRNNYFINEPLFLLFKNFDLSAEISSYPV
ncbi:MAG TPA: Fic family protein [Bacteroidales bacterium]|nr:Fic family protein [Bacteroidales bacterium]HRT78834.1 Fic family protein [Paludibacteraceae bacterium]HOK73776.1 Fic family protein [Bacteroidales bacterium]HOM39381.1 Fic family protein [Bacteroidales bacterium]HPP91490.1 Fic family protein [Bacteroidales bacterium]